MGGTYLPFYSRDHKDGFIIPYQEMIEYANTHPDFDISSITVFAPDDV